MIILDVDWAQNASVLFFIRTGVECEYKSGERREGIPDVKNMWE